MKMRKKESVKAKVWSLWLADYYDSPFELAGLFTDRATALAAVAEIDDDTSQVFMVRPLWFDNVLQKGCVLR